MNVSKYDNTVNGMRNNITCKNKTKHFDLFIFQEIMIFPIGVINNFYYAISSKKRTKTSHEVHEISLRDNRIFLNNN